MFVPPSSIRNILIVRTDRIGELLLTVPIVRALRKKYPKVRITFLAHPESRDVVVGNSDIDEIIDFPPQRNETWWQEARRLMRILGARPFDVAIVGNARKAYHLALFLKRVPVRIGFRRKWPFLLTHKIEDRRRLGEAHEVDHNRTLLEPLMASVPDSKPHFPLDAAAEVWSEEALRSVGWGTKDLVIAMSPFSTHPKKEWEAKGFNALAARLIKELRAHIVFLGGPADRGRSQGIEQGLNNQSLNLCGRTTLKQVASVLARTRVLISNDSGLVHIAASLDVPTVVLFRNDLPADNPKRWGPYGGGHRVIESPPGEAHKKYPPVDEVFKACLNQLSKREANRKVS